ncbi:MAG: hypothetical protein ACLQVF_24415 [Isosphaeraceae bacterium]
MRGVTRHSEHPLLDVLKTRDEGLYRQAQHLITRAKEILPHVLSTFPSGTAHGPENTTTVEAISHLMIAGDFISKLSDRELFFHVLSCHFHDLGMVGTEADNESRDSRDQVRRDHAVRIAERLRARWEELGFDNRRIAEILGEICRGHRPRRTADGGATWDDLNEVSILGVNEYVRTRLLAALIYAVDELHLGADRAPERVRNWKEIQNDEARRHWGRHAAIYGPSQVQHGKLSYEVRVETIAFEEDIRRHALRKALRGVGELRGLMGQYGLEVRLPAFRVEWDRLPLFQLLTIETLSDHKARSVAELENAVFERYRTDSSRRTDLSSLAEEGCASDSEIRGQIARVVQEMVTGRFVETVEGPGERFRLVTTGQISEKIVGIMQTADELDVLYKGPHVRLHTFNLFHSEYGKEYIRNAVFPVAQRVFSIDLSTMREDTPLRILVESCPEVSHLIRNMTPAPSIVVREELATLTAISGALSDVYRSPSIWLDKRIRHSLRALAEEHAPPAVKVLTFLEELALVTGLTPEEASAFTVPPNAQDESGQESPTDASEAGVRLTQTISAAGFGTSGLSYVLLAGQRAGMEVSVAPTSQSYLKIEIEGGEGKHLVKEAGYVLTIGPGQPTPTRRGLWCVIELDTIAPAVIFKGELADSECAAVAPFIVRLPVLSADQQGPQRARLQLTFRPSSVTVGHLASYRAARELLSTRSAEIQLLLGEGERILGRFDVESCNATLPDGGLPDEMLDALLMVGSDIPVPWFGIQEDLDDIVSAPAAEKVGVFYRVTARPAAQKPKVTAISIDCVTSNGIKFDEEFLGLFPDLRFAPPVLSPGAPVTQDEFNRGWADRTVLIQIGAFYREQYPQLAAVLKDWSKDPQKPFPLQMQSEANALDIRTAVEIAFEPARDRLWYVEHPIRITLRPATLGEQYEVEKAYWASKGDQARVELVEERLERLRQRAGAAAETKPATRTAT